MEVSKLTFTQETKAKLGKPLNKAEIGRLRRERLATLDATGELAMAKNRKDVAKLLGRVDGTMNAWLSVMVHSGVLTETLLGFDKQSKPEYEYHVADAKLTGAAKPAKPTELAKPAENQEAVLEISKGDLVIKVRLERYEQASTLIKELVA